MRLLLLEDEADLAHPIVAALRSERFDVAWARTLDEARTALVEQDVDLAILDVMLPGDEDGGFRFASELRSVGYAGGILFLTARDSVSDRVEGLELGGDDYLVKPFSLRELLARVKALLRRPAQTRGGALERGRLMVDLNARRVAWDGTQVSLSEREFAIIELFALYPDRVFPVEELLDRFFPDASSGHRVVRVYVSQIRQAIDVTVIATVPGGYRLGP